MVLSIKFQMELLGRDGSKVAEWEGPLTLCRHPALATVLKHVRAVQGSWISINVVMLHK